MTYFRYFLCLTLVLLLSATAQAQQNKKKSSGQTQQQNQAPPPPPPAASKQADQTLRKVDRQLQAYATSAARTELGGLAQDQSAGPLTALGRIYEQEKNYAEALKCLQKAGEMDPTDPAPFVYLGEAYLNQKRQNEASTAFREAEKRAAAANEHYFLGVARLRLGQYGPAEASLIKAREQDPSDALPVYQLGLTKALQGKWQDSVDLFTKALELNANLAYAYYYRGQSAS